MLLPVRRWWLNNKEKCKELVCQYRIQGYTWTQVTALVNKQTGNNVTERSYRRLMDEYTVAEKPTALSESETSNDFADEILVLNKERILLSDYNNQIKSLYRRIAREDTIRDLGIDAAKELAKKTPIKFTKSKKISGNNDAILLLSDWHYGMEFEIYNNKYSIEECKLRLDRLLDEVIDDITTFKIETLYVVNLGDLISGRIHLPLRINSRVDVLTQVLDVCELLSQFLASLTKYVDIKYCSTDDNHSRIEPLKENSLELENLTRVIDYFLRERLKDSKIEFISNVVDDSICTFSIKNFNYLGVHGHKDKPKNFVEKLSTITKTHYDAMFSAHLHHFYGDESSETLHIGNGSLMGTDDYAFGLRFTSKASQTLIIVSDNNPCEYIHRIILN